MTLTVNQRATRRADRPRILVFDSGLGGLTVFRAIAACRPNADYVYAADDAGFPYGPLAADVLVARVAEAVSGLVAVVAPDIVVIACNTASTAVLPHLRGLFPGLPFVGTVPAIKPAAEQSVSKMISVLATPGTVARDYTRALVDAHAAYCSVELVGSPRLAPIAEDFMRGEPVDEAEIARETAPCFVERDGARTDTVVLACTHYPLILDALARAAPWPVAWIDPAPAIARRVESLLAERFPDPGRAGDPAAPGRVIFTSGRAPEAALDAALRTFGLFAEETVATS